MDTVQKLKDQIYTLGYYHKRMKYFRRKEKNLANKIARKNWSGDYTQAAIDMIRYHKKADWYRRRIGWEPILCNDTVIELELTKETYNALIETVGGHNAKDALWRLQFTNKLESIFGCSIPIQWFQDYNL